jgi:hypothetical protein
MRWKELKQFSAISLLFLLLLCSAACERNAPTYTLKNGRANASVNHYDLDVEEPQYIKVKKSEYRKMRRDIEARNDAQKRRNRVYFPRK